MKHGPQQTGGVTKSLVVRPLAEQSMDIKPAPTAVMPRETLE